MSHATTPIQIPRRTARRYLLGRQGLWPGRRWRGAEGAAQAARQAESVQIDTINVVSRNHDIKLWSRVLEYTPEMLDTLLYTDRQFFDYGNILMVYPMADLPYFETVMQYHRGRSAGYSDANAGLLDFVRARIREEGPLGSRDFENRERIRGGFNTVKDTAHALHVLWINGELMTSGRRGFDRLYDLFENVAGRPFGANPVTEAAAERHFALKALRDVGLATPAEWNRRLKVYCRRAPGAKEAKCLLDKMTEEGAAGTVTIEGRGERCLFPRQDADLLETLEAGRIPAEWQPLGASTDQEVNFLAPLDNVVWDRARMRAVFDFDYVWEVYKPAALRKWGYYTLPILWGDELAARMAVRLDRKCAVLTIEGFWLEREDLAHDAGFRIAFAAGLARFARFHQVERLNLTAVQALMGSDFAV